MNDTATMADRRPRRPLSISILAVVMVLYGLFTLVPKILLLTSQEVYEASADLTASMTEGGFLTVPLELQIAIGFVASMVVVLAGIFVWRGLNWARWAVALWMIFSLALYVLQTGLTWLPAIKLPVFFLVLFLLFRPRVAEHFR